MLEASALTQTAAIRLSCLLAPSQPGADVTIGVSLSTFLLPFAARPRAASYPSAS
ncbi:MAG: hypothetical protein AAF690_28855 [Acidobacteriota bacterium]